MDESIRRDWGSGADNSKVFQLLSDGTRLEILHALWEAYDPENPAPVRFAELRERVGVDDPGRLNYHLNKLAGHFVRRTADGYELREAGKRIIRVVIAGMATDDVTIEPTPIDVSCVFCNGPTELEYKSGQLFHWCTRCTARCVANYPPSLLSNEEVPSAGMVNRTSEEMYHSNRTWIKHREASVMQGVCPDCSGPVPVRRIRICDEHHPDPEDDDVCDGCGSIYWGMVHHVCEVCRSRWQIPTLFYPTTHPAVIAFYYDHGIEFDSASHEKRVTLLDYVEEVISADPFRFQTTIPLEGDELRVTFDEQLSVVDVSQ
jgi:DNA-binding transcriptional ArsR family regulator